MEILFSLQSQYINTLADNFTIFGTTSGNVTIQLASNITKAQLISGYVLDLQTPNITGGTVCSTGVCTNCVPWVIQTPIESPGEGPVQTQTPTPTPTPTTELSLSQTPTPTSTVTQTQTPTPTPTSTPITQINPISSPVYIFNVAFSTSCEACTGTINQTVYKSINDSLTTGTILYTDTNLQFILVLPQEPETNWFLMEDEIGTRYASKISNEGIITELSVCNLEPIWVTESEFCSEGDLYAVQNDENPCSNNGQRTILIEPGAEQCNPCRCYTLTTNDASVNFTYGRCGTPQNIVVMVNGGEIINVCSRYEPIPENANGYVNGGTVVCNFNDDCTNL